LAYATTCLTYFLSPDIIIWYWWNKDNLLVNIEQKLFAQIIVVIVFFVFASGVIPMQNDDFLYQAGVVAIFAPSTSVAKAACQIMEILLED